VAWGQRFAEVFGVTEAPAVGLATATFGLVMGGIIGGPVAIRLIRRLQAQGAPLGVTDAQALPHDAAESTDPFTAERLTMTIMLIATSAAAGAALARWTDNALFTLPAFVWTLLVGAVLRNGFALAKVHVVDGQALAFAGAVALSIFLAMALMSLRLWEIASLAVPMIVILALQAMAVAAYVSVVTFRVMGGNYEAAVLVAGQCGFGLGATPTAIANLQAVSARYGAAPLAFLLVPVVGAFLIDIANALVISLFVNVVLALRP
jgi:ESS family glutamate:Na+ symporter